MACEYLHRNEKVPAILRVTPLEDFRLKVEFGSGSILELNMKNKLCTVRYYPLNDPQIFQTVATDSSKIIFDKQPKYELDIFAQDAVKIALLPTGGSKAILRVQPLKNWRIRLELSSGSILELNLEHYQHTVCHNPLKNAEIFQSVTTDGNNLLFGDTLQITGDELASLALTIPLSEN